MNILAIDPGEHIGVCYKLNGELITDTLTIREDLYDLILKNKWDQIVYERFYGSGRIASYGIDTVEIVGAIKALCFVANLKSEGQPPQKRIAFSVLSKGKTPHERDAMAHLLAWEYYNEDTINRSRESHRDSN